MALQTDIREVIQDEAERLAAAALAERLPLRLMGGLAVWLRSPSVRKEPYARSYADLDFAADSGARKAIKMFLESHGYVPEKLFNAMHGAQRLNYGAPDGRWTIDLIFDSLVMSHKLALRGRMSTDEYTLPLADLLLTKLQIWEINEKDLGDLVCLLADHPLDCADDGVKATDCIDVGRVTDVLSADWGFCHTVERNLASIKTLWARRPVEGARCDVGVQVDTLLGAIDLAPKSFGWKARARVGERVRWYETPENIQHVS
jgi:hypothetical protein